MKADVSVAAMEEAEEGGRCGCGCACTCACEPTSCAALLLLVEVAGRCRGVLGPECATPAPRLERAPPAKDE